MVVQGDIGAGARITRDVRSFRGAVIREIFSRNAGVNEFLAKPISAQALYSRLTSIIELPRPFIRTKTYFGPCRRRRNLGAPRGMKERRADELEKPRDKNPRESYG